MRNYFNNNEGGCSSCSISGCLECSDLETCKQCDENRNYFLDGSVCSQCDVTGCL